MLYIVRFLHQTTTFNPYTQGAALLYIVRFLHQTTTCRCQCRWASWLYIVRFLHQTTTRKSLRRECRGCISSVSYIKPQLQCYVHSQLWCCISSVSYIKPQPKMLKLTMRMVVYRPFPTSNHNLPKLIEKQVDVVYRPFPTSNHNYNCLLAFQ